MEKDPKILLRHMLECIVLVERYTKGKQEYHFIESVDLQDKGPVAECAFEARRYNFEAEWLNKF